MMLFLIFRQNISKAGKVDSPSWFIVLFDQISNFCIVYMADLKVEKINSLF